MKKLKDMDIVYVVKDAAYNDELKWSLRSVEKNFPHKRVWFYGGKVVGLHPDKQVVVKQEGSRKYDRVRNMLKMIAENDEITEDFVLFNDDFFVMDKVESLPYLSDMNLSDLCVRIEIANGYRPTPYTTELKRTIDALNGAKLTDFNYELHVPIIFNRKRLLKIIEKFPDNRATRSLYVNDLLSDDDIDIDEEGLDFEEAKDVKVWGLVEQAVIDPDIPFLSTEDRAFSDGLIGNFIKEAFPEKSKWES